MERVRSLAPLIVAIALLAACTPQELGEFMLTQDLRKNENHEQAAAGYAAQTVDDIRTAQETADEALRDKDPEKLKEAAEERSADPRYDVYLAALALADGNGPLYQQYLQDGSILYQKTQAANADETMTRWILVILGGLDRALAVERARATIEPERIKRLEYGFCLFQLRYRSRLEALSNDVLDTLYAGKADCTGWHP
jgi:hypothetical protein